MEPVLATATLDPALIVPTEVPALAEPTVDPAFAAPTVNSGSIAVSERHKNTLVLAGGAFVALWLRLCDFVQVFALVNNQTLDKMPNHPRFAQG